MQFSAQIKERFSQAYPIFYAESDYPNRNQLLHLLKI